MTIQKLAPWLLVLSLLGCTPPPPPPKPAPQKTPEQISKEREQARLGQIHGRLERARSVLGKVGKDEGQVWSVLQNLQALKLSAAKTKYEDDVEKLIAEVHKNIEDLARQRLDAVAKRADELVEKGDYAGAQKLLDEAFGDDEDLKARYKDTAAYKECQKKLAETQLLFSAETDFDACLSGAVRYKGQGDLAMAIAVLISYPDRYQHTKWYPQVQEAIDQYLKEYDEAKMAKEKQLDIPWKDLPVDDSLSNFVQHTANDAQVFKADGDVLDVSNTSGASAQLEIGEDKWVDWSLEFDIKVPAGQTLNLGIRSQVDPMRQVKTYENHALNLQADDWTRLSIEVRDGKLRIVDLTTKQTLLDTNPVYYQGGFAFNLLPDDKFQVKNIRYKVLSRVEDEKKEEAGKKDENGKGEKGG